MNWKVDFYEEIDSKSRVHRQFFCSGTFADCLAKLVDEYPINDIADIRVYKIGGTWYERFCRVVYKSLLKYLCLEDDDGD